MLTPNPPTPKYPPTEALPLAARPGDATVPSEAWDETHPDHGDFVIRSGRCFADHRCPYLHPSPDLDVHPSRGEDTLDP